MRSLQRVFVVMSLMVIAAMVGGVGGREALAKQPHFVDNGDGTITDNETRLQWEKKVAGSACVHCVDGAYTWSDAMLSFIAAVNNSSADGVTATGLGGYNDWRLPTIDELQTIVDLTVPGCGSGSPCIDPIFGPTVASSYCSSTTFAGNSSRVWSIYFANGSMFAGLKEDISRSVRAVRGGQ